MYRRFERADGLIEGKTYWVTMTVVIIKGRIMGERYASKIIRRGRVCERDGGDKWWKARKVSMREREAEIECERWDRQ